MERYRRLVEKVNYLTMTRPYIAYLVNVVRQFMSAPRMSHWDVVVRILQYVKSTPGRGLLYSDCGYNYITGFSVQIGHVVQSSRSLHRVL